MDNLKLESLRAVMHEQQVHAYIQPYTDPHQSEYIPEHWKFRTWLTGFSGSAGTAVVTHQHAGLWTDSRYFLQARQQLESPFVLHELVTRGPEYLYWLLQNLEPNSNVGIDGRLISEADFLTFQTKLGSKSIALIDTGDLTVGIWETRPVLMFNSITLFSDKLAGKTRDEKLMQLRHLMSEQGATHYLATVLDSIAYLLNIRGTDIDYNPVAISFCLVSHQKVLLFTDATIEHQVMETLKSSLVEVAPYNMVADEIKNLPSEARLWADLSVVNHALAAAIPERCEVINKPCPIVLQKAIKNSVEIENYRWAQIRDGIAVCSFLQWLEKHYAEGGITEQKAAQKIEKFRSIQPNYVGPSFETIAAFGANGALPHYHCNPKQPTMLEAGNLFLIDSGGQYTQGTTDITRTVSLGEPTPEQKRNFTLVLKGHIRLANAVFPYGTKGYQLDALARYDLWQDAKNFGHGTGHGIGYFLNVHEGPQGISASAVGNATTVLEPGMLITNEPGIYIENEYGIRTENVMLCLETEQSQFGRFLKFETLSWAPIDLSLIDLSLLNHDEREWINRYHQKVFETIGPRACQEVKEWLRQKTQPVKL